MQFGFWEIVLTLAVILVLFGPRRLPEVGKALGSGIREFQQAIRGSGSDAAAEAKAEPLRPMASPEETERAGGGTDARG